ncbi:MAG: hypothetical protein ACRDRL_07200 [Sciscionella sp.]
MRSRILESQVVESLARVLRLSGAEHDLLYWLAGHDAPSPDAVPSCVASCPINTVDSGSSLLPQLWSPCWWVLTA